jgi:hypothetical protein
LITKFVVSLYVIATILFIAAPIVHYLIHKERALITELYIPGIDTEKIYGYTVITTIHLIMTLFTAIATFVFDVIILSFSYYILTLNQLFKVQLDEAAEFLLNTETLIPKNRKILEKHLRDLILSHKYIMESQ